MISLKKISIISFLLISLIGCQVTIPPAVDNSSVNHNTNATSLTVLDAKPLRGSESELPYTQTLIALRNRALVTGANALSITGWEEKGNVTTLTAHFFDCHSKRGL